MMQAKCILLLCKFGVADCWLHWDHMGAGATDVINVSP